MKTRLLFISILLFILTVLLSRNDERITDTLLSAINPIKQSYKTFIKSIEDKSDSYLFQKESIEKLNYENRVLRKRLLEQMHYIEQVKNIYTILPDLSHQPLSSTSIVETISYIKLNTFSQIILTKPKGLIDNNHYGIVQGRVVAGVARAQHNQLYGYLTSDEKCRFSVFIGESNAPGIAIGYNTNTMIIKFIPKWHQIKVGDKVITSGLDNIFFTNIPVGIVTKIEVQSSYTVAYIKTYNDVFHPRTFLLINNAKSTLTENFDNNHTRLERDTNATLFSIYNDINKSIPNVSSIPTIISSTPTVPSISTNHIDQTQEEIIVPEAIEEDPIIKKPKVKKRPKRQKPKPKHNSNTLDLF